MALAGVRRPRRRRAHARGPRRRACAEPYESRVVLPHERTHAARRRAASPPARGAGRSSSRSSCSTTARRPPAPGARARPRGRGRARALAAPDRRLAEAFADRQLLIADGHHRYETALAFHDEDGRRGDAGRARLLDDPGLMIFPTHRVFEREPGAPPGEDARGRPAEALDDGRPTAPPPCSTAAAATSWRRRRRARRPARRPARPRGHRYTPDWQEAVAPSTRGEAEAAFLLRPTRSRRCSRSPRAARRCRRRAPTSIPKLLSGLLFLPL